ncbi:MAG: FAD-binding oxidoreductase [Alphaproteobacteria bacterium]
METRLPIESVLWAKTAAPAAALPQLDGEVEADVAIIGAGYCGLTAALKLAEAGRSVIVVEAEEPGFGGAGRNNGHCVPDWTWHTPGEVDARFGARGDRVNGLQGDAADYVFSLIRDHQIECEAVQSGTLTVVRHPKSVAKLRAKYDHWARLGKAVRWVERADMGDYIGSDAFAAAILFGDGGHLNPMGFCRGLAAAAMKAGALIHGKSPATALERRGGRWRITTPGGRVTANTVLLATNAHRNGLWPALDNAFYIVRSAGVATDPLPEDVRRAVLPRDNNVQELHHPRYFYFYFDGEGRLLTGGGAGLGIDQSVEQVGAWVGKELSRLFPDLGRLHFKHYWQGLLDMSPSRFPGVHRLSDNLYTAIGFSGRGVPTATAVGRDIAAMLITGDEDAMAMPLTPLPHAPFARLGTRLITNVVIPFKRIVGKLS